MASAADTLFDRNGSSDLSADECVAIAGSTYFNIGVASLPSYIELVSTGRMTIIQNGDLRASLVNLQQAQGALSTLILVQTIASLNSNLGLEYPDIIRLESIYDEEQKEIRSAYTCDLAGMRGNHAFLNDFSVMADRYDAYVRDGLLPWSSQFENVHTIVD